MATTPRKLNIASLGTQIESVVNNSSYSQVGMQPHPVTGSFIVPDSHSMSHATLEKHMHASSLQ